MTVSTRASVDAPLRARWRQPAPWVVAALFGLAATALSAAGSSIASLWGDEAASLMSAERPLSSLFAMLGTVDAVHGTYYAGLHMWVAVFGPSPFSIRFPSAIAVGFAVAATVHLAGRLGTRRLAVIAGIVACVLPRVTYMGEEARSYAFSAAFAAWLTVVFVEIVRSGAARRRLWVAYGALLAVGTYLFLYVALFAVVHAVLLAALRVPRATVVRWGVSSATAFVATAPLIIVALTERKQISYLANTDQLSFDTLTTQLWFGTPWLAMLAWALIVVAVGAAVIRRRAAGRVAPATRGFERMPGAALETVALAWLLVPTLVLIGLHAVVPDFTARYVSFCAPAAALLIASGIHVLSGRRVWMVAVACAAVVGLAAPAYLAQRTPYAKNDSDWAAISQAVGAHARPGDAVVFDESVRPSRRPRLALRTYPDGFRGLLDVTLAVPYYRNTSWADVSYTLPQAIARGRFSGVERVWLIEYSSGRTADDYGVAELDGLGFHPTGARYTTHRSAILEFTRAAG